MLSSIKVRDKHKSEFLHCLMLVISCMWRSGIVLNAVVQKGVIEGIVQHPQQH